MGLNCFCCCCCSVSPGLADWCEIHDDMADLAIRNLTAVPLELKVVERSPDRSFSHGKTQKLKRKVSGLLRRSDSKAQLDDQADQPREVSFPMKPFETCHTDVRPPDPTREVTRLTFESEGHRYQVDVPSESRRSSVMTKLEPAGPREFTVVYVQQRQGRGQDHAASTLAVFSSANLAAWMGELRDELPLSALSMPGTHNSPTCHVALPSVRCQALSVRAQLDNGVRFFDVRVSVSPDSTDLALVHAQFPISLTGTKWFADFLADLYAFLDAHPSEALVVSVKREGMGKGDDQRLSRVLRERYHAGAEARWYTEPRIPRLGEARGRIVLLRRHGNDPGFDGEWGGRGWGLDGSVWPDNCADGLVGSGIARVQDFYEIDQSTNIGKKIDWARAHLERAGELACPLPGQAGHDPGRPAAPFFINFLSASNTFHTNTWPEKIAAKVNPAVIEYLCTQHGEPEKGPGRLAVGDASTGVVMTDWVGLHDDFDLIRCIVGWNARLQLSK